MANFKKIGGAFFRESDTGELYAVSDPDTLRGLSKGQLSYNSVENSRGLSFAGQTTAPAPETNKATAGGTAGADIGSLVKQKLIDALTNYKGVTNTDELEQKRQGLLRKQLLSSPYSTEGEASLTGAQKLSLLRTRGQEFEPEISALESQILKAKQGDSDSISSLKSIASLAKDIGIFGETETHSPLYKEYLDAKKEGYEKDFNSYRHEDANLRRPISGSGLDATTASKVGTIASAFDTSQLTKDFNVVQNKLGSMQRIVDAGVGGPGDLALVFEFMKALDPNSVVRETEYANAAKSGNIFIGMYTKYNGYLKEEGGFMPEQVKKSFIAIMEEKYKVSQIQYNNYRTEQIKKINKWTGKTDGADYLSDFGSANVRQETKTVNGITYIKVEGGWKKQ